MTPRPQLPRWRSLLYVPTHNAKMVAGAHRRGADAIIFDLEDSVPDAAKEAGRAALSVAVAQVAAEGSSALVRINKPWSLAWRDVEAAVEAGADGLLLPKVEDGCQVAVITSYLDELSSGEGGGKLVLLALIESSRGLGNLEGITASSRRLVGIIPGNEDLATELGIQPDPERMLHLYLPVLVAARSHGLDVYGTLGGSAGFRDLEAFRQRVNFSKSWGFRGATCIHPAQVSVIHEVFAPDEAEVRRARRIVEAFESGSGDPMALDGSMIDRPVYLRAQRLLEQLEKS